MDNNPQIQRITDMEQKLNTASQTIQALADALEQYAHVRRDIESLSAYYLGPQWREDYEADCRGELPQDLPRGVLSEDAVYDLLTEHDSILAIMAETVGITNTDNQ